MPLEPSKQQQHNPIHLQCTSQAAHDGSEVLLGAPGMSVIITVFKLHHNPWNHLPLYQTCLLLCQMKNMCK
jgi:hypothetical protein